jgi:hypothetical protein
MIDAFLGGEDWDEAPEAMAFEAPFGSILSEATRLVEALSAHGSASRSDPDGLASAARRLYVLVPALVNVTLNYKICVEHGLPLHPTVYYELAEARKYKIDHSMAELGRADRLYLESIELSRAAYRLDPAFAQRAAVFKSALPEEVPRFVYTSGLDKYSWRASEPEKLRALERKVRSAYKPELLLAAAHGSIMPGLLLAEYLELPLYFIRFSMFKRKDEAPIVSLSDKVWLSSWRERSVLLYDEDVAKGTTLEIFTRSLSPLFAQSRSACSIRHAGSSFSPDFVAKYWWD